MSIIAVQFLAHIIVITLCVYHALSVFPASPNTGKGLIRSLILFFTPKITLLFNIRLERLNSCSSILFFDFIVGVRNEATNHISF